MAVIKAKQLADGRWECQGCLVKFTRYKRDLKHPDGWVNPPKFHDDACRKAFHHGGLSMKKIMGIMRQVAREEISASVRPGALLKAEEARA
jgi:hypothetical protein